MYKIRKRLFFTMHITHYFFEICSVDNKKKEEVHEKKKTSASRTFYRGRLLLSSFQRGAVVVNIVGTRT